MKSITVFPHVVEVSLEHVVARSCALVRKRGSAKWSTVELYTEIVVYDLGLQANSESKRISAMCDKGACAPHGFVQCGPARVASLCETTGAFITPTESIKAKLRREGVEHQPGPMLVESVPPITYDAFPDLTIIESINLTSLRTTSVQAKTRKAHIGMYQTANVPKAEHAEVIREFAEAKWKLLHGPLGPEKSIAAAGAAGAARNPKLIKDIEAMTAKFKAACNSGRLGFYEVGIGKGEQIRIVNVYGWTAQRSPCQETHCQPVQYHQG